MTTNEPAERILFVDDDPRLLQGMRRRLRGQYDIETALGPKKGLEVVEYLGPFAVVVADMNMPGMDGASFLAAVRRSYPDIVPMMLTGNTDLQTAMLAVNRGQVFRFMTKPCAPGDLEALLDAGIAQHRLLLADRRAVAAEQASRAKSEFLATVSHELKTPLSVVRSSAEILTNFVNDEPAAVRDEFVGTILHEARRLEGLIDQLLNLAEMDAGLGPVAIEHVNLSSLIAELATELELGSRLCAVSDPAKSLCSGDVNLLRQAFREVLDNAAKFSPPDEPIVVLIDERGSRICVDIHDRGSGIDPDLGATVFEPFVQCMNVLTGKPRGLGLGLTLAAKAIERHGGSIQYAPDAIRGSHFVIDLPRPLLANAQ